MREVRLIVALNIAKRAYFALGGFTVAARPKHNLCPVLPSGQGAKSVLRPNLRP